MNIVDLIIKKRDGGKLTKEEIDFFIDGVTHETIADYQVSAMLMAMFFNPLDTEETAILTQAMTYSGETYDLSGIKGIKVDKHSTGGVADTTTLILAPLVASTGVPVVKMSGRGLGFSGGTLDKLEAIPGFNVSVSKDNAIKFVNQSKIVIMSQSENLTPADKKLYAMRDVTGTVDSMPLIVGSIMSKKIAAGADAIVLDVKCGSGAFMKDYESAKELAKQMCEIGKAINRRVTAVITSMEQPLGQNIGNALEVIEAIEILKGNVQGDLLEVSLTLGAYMLINANRVKTVEEGRALLTENIKNGKGLEKFRELIVQQNGNPNVCDDYSLFQQCTHSLSLKAEKSGFIEKMDTALIGRASVETGAGRKEKTDTINYGAGIIMKVRIGDYVNIGDTIATVFSSSKEKCQTALSYLKQAIYTCENNPQAPPLILDII
ncbi:MAG: thymidine phosphorylase [Anaerotignaceae bacterium]